jgi:hypothetical protein
MLDRWKAFSTKPQVLLALLVFQSLLYWMIAIYAGSAAVPVAYQRF